MVFFADSKRGLDEEGIHALMEALEALKPKQSWNAFTRGHMRQQTHYIDLLKFEIAHKTSLSQREFEDIRTKLSGEQLAHLLGMKDDLPYHAYVAVARKLQTLHSKFHDYLQGNGYIEDHAFLVEDYGIAKEFRTKEFKELAAKQGFDADAEMERFFTQLDVREALSIANQARGAFDKIAKPASQRAAGVPYAR